MRIFSSVSISILYLLFLGNSASAQTARLAVNGDRTPLTINLQTGNTIQVSLTAGRSYTCQAIPTGGQLSNLSWEGFIYPRSFGDPIPVSYTGDFSPVISVSNPAAHRISFTAPITQAYRLVVATAFTGGQLMTISCKETTLYGGFNTNANNFNFLELTNISNQTIAGEVTATNYDGTVVINQLAFTVLPGRRYDLDLHSSAGPNRYGTVSVTSNSPAGSLIGVISQYSGSPTNFELRSTTELHLQGE